MALPRERLARLEARSQPDQLAGRALGDPEAASAPLGEGGDGEIRLSVGERAQIADEVRVGEHDRTGRRGELRDQWAVETPSANRWGANRWGSNGWSSVQAGGDSA